MLTSLNRMVGLPVVWQDRQLGYVERAVPDARARRLSGVVVRKGILSLIHISEPTRQAEISYAVFCLKKKKKKKK